MLFHFVKTRKIFYALSILVIVPGIISLFVQGLNLGIDFTSGSIVEVRFDQTATVEQVREVVTAQGLDDSKIQQSGENTFLIRTGLLTQEQGEKLTSAFTEKFGNVTLLRNEYVDPIISTELFWGALGALAVAAVLMIIYITIRFEFKQGLVAVIAILHDMLVVVGIFSLFRIEVDSTFVAAILTIIGYSINDTIVIFDRIRENMRMRRKGQSLEDLVNLSLWQTITRSINTGMSVLFVLLALYFLGGVTLKVFVLAMFIGVLSGTYSSIFNACPLWVDFKNMEKREKKQLAKA